ncbi:replication initiation protein (plasmid) [Vibrio campbellii]|uniref:replication initiation protein n=1 Tax=Vibrio campbellii TaxID=680 RepID=UPI001F07310F|nr:replication initiation protein [Vibrio campbellii]UMM07103.1 replication initiation protein [Vibrio campbellii]
MTKLTIVHSNDLVEAAYSLSLDEMRLISLASTKVDSRKPNVGEIRIDVAEYIKAYGLSNKNSYQDLREAVKSLMRKPIKIVIEDKVREISWLDMNEYNRSNRGSHVIISFSRYIEPYLFDLKDRFTSINFEYASRLNTPFSFRLYQWLIKAKKLNKNKQGEGVVVELEVEWMKCQAALSGKYEIWRDFSSDLLKPAIERINANTDISVIYEPIKTGRKVTAVKFTYVVEVGSEEKPLRPRLTRRPKVTKGSHEEGVWMRKNLALLLDYEAKLKAYDKAAKLTLPDLRKMIEYASVAERELQIRLSDELKTRKRKNMQ